jgi:holliday junction DNA helicase RuvA
MIAFLEGDIMDLGKDDCTVLVQGVGYRVYPVAMQLENGQRVAFYIYDHIREDRRQLFGFENKKTLHLFEQLIGVSGIGPKLAQGVLGQGDQEVIASAILGGDVDYLVSMPGIGKKTAQKIILELKGALVLDSSPGAEVDEDVLEALIGLGYRRKDCLAVLKDVQGGAPEERIRFALQLLSR